MSGPTIDVVHLDLEPGWRGGQRQLFLLLRELAGDESLRLHLVHRQGSPYPERLHGAGVLSRIRLSPVGNRLEAWFRLARPAGPTVYHAHTGNTIPLAVLAGRRSAAVSLVTRRLDLAPRRFPLLWADHVVAISERVDEVLAELGLPAARRSVIPSAVDLSRRLDGIDVDRLRRRAGLPEGAEVGLTVGALVEQKDPLTLVRALPRLPETYHHVWVGEGPLLEPAWALADRLGVIHRLHMPGFDPAPDAWFSLADLFVLPSVHEGLGTVLLDAFHFEVPVVASRIPGTSDLLIEGKTAALFPAGDAAALAGRIREIRAEARLARRLTRTATRCVGAYDIRRTTQEYARLYRRLVEPTRS